MSHDDYEPEPQRESAAPQDVPAEMSVLGSMLLSRDAIADVTEIIKNPADFYRPAHQTIYRAIVTRYNDGAPVDPIVLNDDLTKSGDVSRIGGVSYLHTLVQQVPTAANGEYYAQIVHDKAVLRNLQSACHRTLHEISDGACDTGEMLDDLRAAVDDIVDDAGDGNEDTLIGADGEDFLEHLENLQKNGPARGVQSGFTDLDSLTSGFQPGQFIVIAARPAVGKSTLGTDIARQAAIVDGLPTVFFSLEMSRTELKMKIASAQARVPLHHLQFQGGMTDDDWARLAKVWPAIDNAPLDIVDDAGLTLTKIRSHCRRIQRKRDLRLVVVDYLQLMEGELSGRNENRQQEVAKISRSLKKLAAELQVPVIAMSQLNRGAEQRQDKKPLLSDLRESGAIEQDANMVILLHREDAYDRESPRAGEADFIVAKNRGGPTATITTAFQGHYSRFVDMAQT
ncbi:replicative DNA helicase [Streptomyces griseofuscus]|uniref:replicative DNA helicase n=1 Tax=Streptomyces griseofuscus TaxID=146922 RepID=UPI001FE94B64|nr:replicative DNA helicase [Streptomyces griseofuscus]